MKKTSSGKVIINPRCKDHKSDGTMTFKAVDEATRLFDGCQLNPITV